MGELVSSAQSFFEHPVPVRSTDVIPLPHHQIILYKNALGEDIVLPSQERIRASLRPLEGIDAVGHSHYGRLPLAFENYLNEEGGFFDQLEAEENPPNDNKEITAYAADDE